MRQASLAAIILFLVSGCGFGSGFDPSSAGFHDSCPYWSGDSRWIAFDRTTGGVDTIDDENRWKELDSDVYVASGDGKRLVRLTQTLAEDEVLGWLEQPSEVIYRNSSGVFAIAPKKGAKPKRLGRLRPDDAVVALSHDGVRAFVAQGSRTPPGKHVGDLLGDRVEGDPGPVIVDFSEKTRQELPRTELEDGYAAWSPDDALLAFARTRDAFPYSELVVMRGDRVVLSKRLISLSGLAWSPDSRKLAYGGVIVGGDVYDGSQIWLLRLDDGSEQQLTHGSGEGENTVPVWSPDGKQIYYESGGSYRSITPAGTNDRKVLGDANDCPEPSPDGTRVAFNRIENSHQNFVLDWSLLMVMAADGSGKRAINIDEPMASPRRAAR